MFVHIGYRASWYNLLSLNQFFANQRKTCLNRLNVCIVIIKNELTSIADHQCLELT